MTYVLCFIYLNLGLPNVGKSSIINSLKRSKSCNVGAVPGVTKLDVKNNFSFVT